MSSNKRKNPARKQHILLFRTSLGREPLQVDAATGPGPTVPLPIIFFYKLFKTIQDMFEVVIRISHTSII
jgi:hypothetical protein